MRAQACGAVSPIRAPQVLQQPLPQSALMVPCLLPACPKVYQQSQGSTGSGSATRRGRGKDSSWQHNPNEKGETALRQGAAKSQRREQGQVVQIERLQTPTSDLLHSSTLSRQALRAKAQGEGRKEHSNVPGLSRGGGGSLRTGHANSFNIALERPGQKGLEGNPSLRVVCECPPGAGCTAPGPGCPGGRRSGTAPAPCPGAAAARSACTPVAPAPHPSLSVRVPPCQRRRRKSAQRPWYSLKSQSSQRGFGISERSVFSRSCMLSAPASDPSQFVELYHVRRRASPCRNVDSPHILYVLAQGDQPALPDSGQHDCRPCRRST